MKKWIIIGTGILLIVLWQAIDIYSTVQADRQDGLNRYMQLIPESAVVQETFRYHGEKRFMVFNLEIEDSVYAYFYVSEDGDTYTLNHDELVLTSSEAMEKVRQEFSELTVIHRITPAISGQDFTWEIVAQDSGEDYQYLYYSMTDGEFQKRFTLSN
ncbi:hypothetical protein [Bacillus horti]|uniref:Uncharacterized protein YpmB n=1 Tax=Caldalkalibacillus horti TaxID=77523 RepID=A0ABT9VWZ4_9BACI|nr:hypothetical protein [Bacillus horti]MDQ0165511.1 uncharacterized protein YpmB [Bacillus horti]